MISARKVVRIKVLVAAVFIYCLILQYYYGTYVNDNRPFTPSIAIQRIAFVIVVTEDGDYTDGAAVLAHSIKLHHPNLSYDLVAIVLRGAVGVVPFLEILGYKIRLVDVPINLAEIPNEEYRRNLPYAGCCGEKQFIRFEIFRMTEYAMVMMVDVDGIVMDNLEDLFYNDKDFQFIYENITLADMTKSKKCINAGFFVTRPNVDHFNRLMEFAQRGNYYPKLGWENSGYGVCYGGEIFQGLMSYYVHVFTDPSRYLELDRCRINAMLGGSNSAGEVCVEVLDAEVRLVHFAGVCAKPWVNRSCYAGSNRPRRLRGFRQIWWQHRQKVEAHHGLLPVKEVDAFTDSGKYIPINRQCLIDHAQCHFDWDNGRDWCMEDNWDLPQMFGLEKPEQHPDVEETVKELDEIELFDGAKMARVGHFLDGYPIWNDGGTIVKRMGQTRVVSVDKMNSRVKRKFAKNKDRRALPKEIVSRTTCHAYWSSSDMHLSSATMERYIYDPHPEAADGPDPVFADLVNIKGSNMNTTLSKYCLVNTEAKSVIVAWEGNIPAWDGGNVETGKYTYGITRGKPSLTGYVEDQGNDRCRLVNTARDIYVYDMRHGSGSIDSTAPYTFNCSTGPSDAESRGYGALADAFYNAIVAYGMLTDRNWGGLSKVTPSGLIKIGVHVQQGFDNAYWDGNGLYFGDGATFFYPLGSCLGSMAHELGHAVTNQFSNLVYSGESGCMNEAFSDITGVMLMKFATGADDWCIANGCLVERDNCMRVLNEPEAYSSYFPTCSDGMTYCQEAHSCGAIPSYMFYKLATTSGWGIRTAGQAFFLANRMVWKQQTSIKQAGCGVVTVVTQNHIAGGDFAAVRKAWAAAGVDIRSCAGGRRSQSNPFVMTNCKAIPNTQGGDSSQIYYKLTVPQSATHGTFSITGPNGDADLYVKKGSAPTTMNYDHRPYLVSSNEVVTLSNLKLTADTDYYIMVNAYRTYTDLEVKSCFQNGPLATPITNCGLISGTSGKQYSAKFYVVEAPTGSTNATVAISGGAGDPDLYVKKGALPSTGTGTYDQRSAKIGADTLDWEGLTIPTATKYFILVHGYSAYSGLTVYACFSP